MRLTLRAQVVLVALVLAVIPLVGYVHVKQMERLLRDGQEQGAPATRAPPPPPAAHARARAPRAARRPAGERRDGARAEEPRARRVAHLDRRPAGTAAGA